jgi:hypothetical protein
VTLHNADKLILHNGLKLFSLFSEGPKTFSLFSEGPKTFSLFFFSIRYFITLNVFLYSQRGPKLFLYSFSRFLTPRVRLFFYQVGSIQSFSDITDKRTDVWFRDFIIWKINSGLWAVVWAGLWNKRVWADYEQLLKFLWTKK